MVKVQDKQKAILEAAVSVFAARGFWNTPTSLISKTAGVADGTLFNYFATKDDLINEVYFDTKRELAQRLLADLSKYDSLKDKMRHFWNEYIDWGAANLDKFKVLHQIEASYEIDETVKAQCMALFGDLEQLLSESIRKGEVLDYPADYVAALVDNQAVMTVQFITTSEDKQVDYKTIGFDILWNGVAG